MSLTFGYDMKEGDKILEAPIRLSKLLAPLVQPGAAIINHFPFCAVYNLVPTMLVVSHSHFQCGTSLHGSHTSAMNHWCKKVGS
jgi:hypothetical protein